jgi:CopG family nickel-responsive transcriptional regulator
MSELNRIGVAIEHELLAEFDAYLERHAYPSRSEGFRDLIRSALADEVLPGRNEQVVGTVSLVYDHTRRQLGDRMTDLQHEFHHTVVSSLHVHLDHDDCLEVIVLRGRAHDVRRLADGLIAMKGVRHGRLTIADVR